MTSTERGSLSSTNFNKICAMIDRIVLLLQDTTINDKERTQLQRSLNTLQGAFYRCPRS